METLNASQYTDQSSLKHPDPPAPAPQSPSHTTPSPPSKPLFLRLSPKIRNRICRYVYTSSVMKVSTDTPGLPLPCKQIYAECTELIYASPALYVEGWDTLLRWLKRLPPHRRNLIEEIWYGADTALSERLHEMSEGRTQHTIAPR